MEPEGSLPRHRNQTLYISISPTFMLADPFWLRKITADLHTLSYVNIRVVHPDDRYPTLKICISELMVDSYEYTPVAYVAMHCMI
jgi:hypothetical protein